MRVSPEQVRSGVTRTLVAFGRFWWDFLIGDTPELFVAGLGILGVAALLAKEISATAAWAVVPLLVIAALVVSVLQGRKR